MTHQQPAPTLLFGRPLALNTRDLLAIGFRHQGLIVATFLLVSIAVTLVGLSRPRMYEAVTKILVKRERAESIVTADETPNFQASQGVTEQEINSEIELLWSRDLHEQVVVANRLHEGQEESAWTALKKRLTGSSDEPQDERRRIAGAVREFETWFSVAPLKKSNLIHVTYASRDPYMAVQIINTLNEQYLAKHLAVHRPVGAFAFFAQETTRYRNELEALQDRAADYGHGQGVVAVAAEKETALRQLTEFEADLERTRIQIAETQERIRALEREAGVTPERTTTEIREASSGVLAQQRGALLTLELKRVELQQVFQPSYPPVQEVEKQIALTRAALADAEATPILEKTTALNQTHEWLTTELAKDKSALLALMARATQTSQSIQGYRQKARHLDGVQLVQENLVRDAKLAEQNYLIYSRKQEEARISDELDVQRIVNVAIAESPTVPFEPAGPGKALILLLALAVAFVCSVVVAFVVDYLDPSFRTPEEVRAFLGVPVLASVSKTTP